MNPQKTNDRRHDPSAAGVRRPDGHREHDEREKAERTAVYEQRAAEGKPLFLEPRR